MENSQEKFFDKKFSNCDLSDLNPQKNTFKFDKITISSNFDGGNLAKCQQTSQNSFDLWISPDAAPFIPEEKNLFRTWFYFSVTGISETHINRVFNFRIMNSSNQFSLFSYGHKPVFSEQLENKPVNAYKNNWKKL